MEGIKTAAFAFFLLGFQLCFVHCQVCEIKQNATGKISLSRTQFEYMEECWEIPVPKHRFIHLKFVKVTSNQECPNDHLIIAVAETNDEYRFCYSNFTQTPNAIMGNVTVSHFVRYKFTTSNFELEYAIKTMECLSNRSFKCDANACIHQAKVCDGVRDCQNGADEIGCVPGVLSIKGVSEAREKAISWLKQKRTADWGWKENNPRTVVALSLASGASFNGTGHEEELMAKQTELKTAVSLIRPSLTNSELSMFINALLATCHNPRYFYGLNLVKRLKEQVGSSNNLTHPLAYLALCNANETWPLEFTDDLNDILNSDSEYPFVQDLQAMAVMALSCEDNRNRGFEDVFENTTLTLYTNTIQNLKKLQVQDGSFGNVYTTALITQALLSSGEGRREGWDLNAAIGYLIKELNSSSVDLLATYLVLPILSGKSLMDISQINCWAHRRNQGDDPVSEINDHLGPKIRVRYSLFIGDEKDVVHTISLRVPENYTASEVMELAQIENPKFKFEWKRMSGKMYVYEIADVTNDPEAGIFWLLFVGAADSSDSLVHLTKGPDEVIMGDGEHLILWYKTATIE